MKINILWQVLGTSVLDRSERPSERFKDLICSSLASLNQVRPGRPGVGAGNGAMQDVTSVHQVIS